MVAEPAAGSQRTRRIVEGFGLTETSPVSNVNPLKGKRKPGSVGIPVPETDVKIVDLEDGTTEMPTGNEGELIIKGPQVMKGYWKRPDATKAMIIDGWLYTGDIAVADEDGYFFIVGRKKDMIVASGYNVYPDEVDGVLVAHPAVLEAATIGVPDPVRGETVKSFVVLNPGMQVTADEIEAYARERLEASRAMRVCRMPLWNVSATATGWPGLLAMSFANQPVETPEDRAAALAFFLALAAVPAAAQIPSSAQAQRLLRENPELVRQRLLESGLSPNEIRARLTASGLPPNELDAFLSGQPIDPATAFSTNAISGLQLLGIVVENADGLELVEVTSGMQFGLGRADSLDLGFPIFGHDVFTRATSQFQPLLSGPVPDDYRVGPGDQFVLILSHHFPLPLQ